MRFSALATFIVLLNFRILAQPVTQVFNYTGSPQTFTVPCASTITLEAWGGGGGGGGQDTYNPGVGGGGSYASATIAVNPGDVLTIYVGGGGINGVGCLTGTGGGAGGFGAGGGGNGANAGNQGCSGGGAGGGGASIVYNGATPVFAAAGGGGGGGGGNYSAGANGGGGDQNGSASGTGAAGSVGTSGSVSGGAGGQHNVDGAGGGGGGGGINGGSGGGPDFSCDCGGSGGAGGQSVATTIIPGGAITPGNSGSPLLCAGCAQGGGSQAPGTNGILYLTYTPNSVVVPVTANASATSVCPNTVVTLTGGGATSYTWSSGVTDGVPFVPGATATYTVTGSNGLCTGTNTVTVTVNPLPNVTATNGVVCNGSSTTLTAGGASTYTWTPSGSLSSSNGSNVTAFPATTTTYTVDGTDVNGCVNSTTCIVTVSPSPTVSVSNGTMCANGNATLTANGAATYAWSPAGGLSATTGSVVTANPGASTSYTVVGSVGTCTSQAVANVTVNPLPIVGVNSSAICVGQQTATLTANGANTYAWSPAGGLSSTSGTSVNATPGATTVYTVTGTDANNCVSTATSTVSVNTLPVVAVNSGTICAGFSMNLNANGASTYTWSPGTGLSSTSGNAVVANPGSTTVYTVSGTDVNTCTNTATSTVTVAPNPTVSVNNASICLGQQTATLVANGASTYAWSPPNGLSSTSGSSVSANPAVTTSYTITGSVGTCTGVTTCTVSVNALPNVTATSTVICNGQNTSVTANGASTYTWSTMQQGSVINVSPSITTSYSVAGTDGNGCINAAVGTVTVNPLPNVAVTSTVICVGTSVILTANGAVVFTWSPPTALSTTVGTSVTSNPLSTITYTVTGTDNNGCSNTALSTVTVNQLPNVTVTSGTICKGKNIVLAATGANTFNWNPGTGLSSSTSASPTASPSITTIYTVTGTDINNCKNTATATVNVNPLPVVLVDPPASSGCVPLCVNFSNLGNNSLNSIFSWTFGNGTLSNQQAPQACYSTAGTFTASLTVTDSNGCKNSSTSVIDAFPVPKAQFSYSPSSTTIFDPGIQFYDMTTGANIATWSWYFGDGDSSAVQDPYHVYPDTGLYYPHVTVFSDHGCWDTYSDVLYIAPEFLLYVPNAFTPNSDNVNDTFMPKGEGIKTYELMIYDRWGELLFHTNDIYTGWDGKKGDTILQEDVYVWKIEVRNIKGEPKHLAGTVSLLK